MALILNAAAATTTTTKSSNSNSAARYAVVLHLKKGLAAGTRASCLPRNS